MIYNSNPVEIPTQPVADFVESYLGSIPSLREALIVVLTMAIIFFLIRFAVKVIHHYMYSD